MHRMDVFQSFFHAFKDQYNTQDYIDRQIIIFLP